MNSEEIITLWLQEIVIKHNFCPFASKVLNENRISYVVLSVDLDSRESLQDLLIRFLAELKRMDGNSAIETSLLIVESGLEDFDDYLDLLNVLEELLYSESYEGIYQLASFHPDYVFDGCSRDAAENFTNRSPLPVFHIIREQGLEDALTSYPNPENIPARNIKYAKEKGQQFWIELLDGLLKIP